ncbi:MAG: hypothetical protein DWQ31_11490 [Planctomycetota bacterium]|nr:MAG: hypothetical protein DWQ31_11490 [Planctomycetota bacterium]
MAIVIGLASDPFASISVADEGDAGRRASARAARQRGDRPKYIIPPPLKDLGRNYKVRVVYFVPTDKEVKNDYAEKIEVLMRVVADIYRRDLKANRQRSRGLDFEFDEEGELQVHLINGDHPSVFYTGEPFSVDRLLDSTQNEVLQKLGDPTGRACLIFSEAGGIAEARPAYPYCGFAMVSGDMLRDEITATTIEEQIENFFDVTPVGEGDDAQPRNKEIQVSNGVLIHELGHIFYMLHDTSDVNRNIMAQGYHNLGKMFDHRTASKRLVRFSPHHARVAAATRFLSESFDERDGQNPALEFTVVRPPPGGQHFVELNLKMSDNAGLHAVICMQRGGGGIDALVGGAALKGKSYEKTVKFRSPHVFLEGQPLQYIINCIDVNGNCSQAAQISHVGPPER